MKTFLICPGFERAGTSWLYKTLSLSSSVNFGDFKEYHYFDSIHLESFKHFKKMNQLHDIFYKFYEDENYYYDYFFNILKNYKISGDFSPGYSDLSKDIFKEILNKFNQNNIDVKVLLLIRNPVDRHISATNMRIQRDHVNINDDEYNKLLINNLTDSIFNANSNYFETNNKFVDVFANNYLCFKYDNLFKQSGINKICDFLNIEKIGDINFENKINKSHYNNNIYSETHDKLISFYKKDTEFYQNYS